jgi:hypothetical protein
VSHYRKIYKKSTHELIRTLPENDLIGLANQLGINREHFIAQVFGENINNIENHHNSRSIGLEALAIFLLGTVGQSLLLHDTVTLS